MVPELTDKSFLKKKPNEYLFSPYKDGLRDSIVINDTAMEILSLCNGINSIEDIIKILKKKYNEKEDIVKQNVEEFLKPFIELGVICDSCKENSQKDFVIGSNKIFYPDILIWELTDYCPLKCKHCYLPKKNNNIYSNEDIEKVFSIIDKSGVCQIQLTGGEALSHPKIGYIIDELIKRGIIISISTSGMILNENILSHLLKLKSIRGSFIRISLDGSEDTHNYIRGNKKSYTNALNFIKTMKANGIPCQVGTTVVNQSKEELETLTSLVKDCGACLIEIGLVSVQGNAKENKLTNSFSQKELDLFLKELSDKFSDKNFIVKLPVQKAIAKTCGAGCHIIVLKANKDVSICPTAEFSVGNIGKQSFDEIMENCGFKFHDIAAPNAQICGDCKNKFECKGCIAKALILKETVDNCPWFKSQYEIFKPFLNR